MLRQITNPNAHVHAFLSQYLVRPPVHDGPSWTEEEHRFVLKMVVAGVAPDQLNIVVDRDQLRITLAPTEKTPEQKNTEQKTQEQRILSWAMPNYIDLDHVTSTLSRGVLSIILPKTQAAPERVVPIEDKDGSLS